MRVMSVTCKLSTKQTREKLSVPKPYDPDQDCVRVYLIPPPQREKEVGSFGCACLPRPPSLHYVSKDWHGCSMCDLILEM